MNPDDDRGLARGDDPAAPADRARPLRDAAGLVALVTLVRAVHARVPDLLGTDDYFHLKMAWLTRQCGAVTAFPWATTSSWSERWADSSWLYHVLLGPFVDLDDPIRSAGVAVSVFSGGLLWLVFRFLRARGCPAPALFLILLLGCGSIFTSRLLMTRALVLSAILVVVILGALIGRRTGLLFMASFVYPLSYTAFQLPPILAGIHLVMGLLRPPPPDRAAAGEGHDVWSGVSLLTPLLAVLAGTALGLMVHPSFPDNLPMWFDQNVMVLGLSWGGGSDLGFGQELGALDTRTLLVSATALVAIQVISGVAGLVRRRPVGDDAVFLGAVSWAFALLTFMSSRFIEYWALSGVMSAGLIARDLIDPIELERVRRSSPRTSRLAFGALGLCLAALLFKSGRELDAQLRRHEPYRLAGPARWLEQHTAPGERVYTADFDDLGGLFFYNHHNRYTMGLDPVFLYQFDPGLFDLWNRLRSGSLTDPYRVIRHDFSSRYAFVTTDHASLTERLRRDPRVRAVVANEACTLFELGDDLALVGDWWVRFPGPDEVPAALDAARAWAGGTPGGANLAPPGADPAPPGADGPPGPYRAVDASSGSGVISLDRLRPGTGAGSTRGAVALALTRIHEPEPSEVVLGLGFDHALELWVNGEPVFADPGPGAGTLDRFRVPARLRAGENRLLVRATRWGPAWGFAVRRPGEPVGPVGAPRDRAWSAHPVTRPDPQLGR